MSQSQQVPLTTPSKPSKPTKPLKGKAILFGLNYKTINGATLQGCVNDVNNMASFLKTRCGIPADVYTDETTPNDTTGVAIMQRIYELALQSYKDKLDFVYIHYSGHGTHIADTNKDEQDGEDEALVPSDVCSKGILTDDFLHSVFTHFNPKTRVLCVFDCCHSGTMCDLKYSWELPRRRPRIESALDDVKARVLAISGCMDSQTSADAYNVLGDGKFAGALTSCLLKSLNENPQLCNDVFGLHATVLKKLQEGGFEQVPVLASTYSLVRSPGVMPLLDVTFNDA